jgi:hypothetical protein
MFTISQTVGRPLERVLECVWSIFDEKLTCVWVERRAQNAAGEYSPEEAQDLSRRVA